MTTDIVSNDFHFAYPIRTTVILVPGVNISNNSGNRIVDCPYEINME